MSRALLDETHVHPAIRNRLSGWHQSIVLEVQAVLAVNDVVVVGMGINPFVKRARRSLEQAGIAFEYLEYGSYFSMWRERTALKMWTGWPTLPMVFVRGILVGGATDLNRLIASGELKNLLSK
ncbi:MAG: glutaredoxin [Pseudomonadota bacterium]